VPAATALYESGCSKSSEPAKNAVLSKGVTAWLLVMVAVMESVLVGYGAAGVCVVPLMVGAEIHEGELPLR
jgi:hypothetical protein